MTTIAKLHAKILSLPADPRYDDFRAARLGFHGTAEPISGPLRPGGFDGLFWLAETPAVAQAYIPLAGLSALLAKPLDYLLDERIRPSRHDIWADIMHQMGHWPREVEHDDAGQARSWTIDDGHPTYGDALRFVAELGYDLEREPAWVAMTLVDGRNRLQPASYHTPGAVYVTCLDGLDILDLREKLGSDLVDPGHRQLELFRRIEAAGHDGVMIDDFAQCGRDHANVGHPSIGLFAGALGKLAFLEYPATHADLQEVRGSATTAFRRFRDALLHETEAVA